MGLDNTGRVNDEATAGAGRGRSISRDAGDTGPINRNATVVGAGRGYEPVRLGARAMAERVRYNKTVVKITPRVDPVVGGGGVEGAFYTMRTVSGAADPDDNGDIYLQGGTVNGDAVTTTSLKLYDIGTDEWEGADDEQLYLTVTGTGVIADGVLLPGFTVSGITVSIGSPPGDTPPTKDDPAGTAILSLGTFFNGGFFPAVAGNRGVAVCIGSFVKTAGA